MPNISEMKSSKFLKREDAGRGTLATIREVTQENVALEGAPQELKWCAHFDELEKGLVLNWTNLQLIARIAKDENTDNWGGVKIVLYDDPNVSFGGKLVGGIRVREPRSPVTQTGKPNSPAPPEQDDDSDCPC